MTGRSIKKHICAMPVVKGYARKSKATRYAGGYLLVGLCFTVILNVPPCHSERSEESRSSVNAVIYRLL